MALLSRLFSSKKNNKPSCNTNAEKNERSSWKPFTFGKDQVRVLLFRECDWRGRKLLFDSNAVQKVALENSCKLRFASRQKPDKCKKEGFVEVTNGYGYQYTKPSADAKLLEEMMFGAVAMTFRGTALKVHTMATPNRLMCTKVFPSPVVTHTNRRTSDRSLEDSYGSSVNSMSEYFSQNSGSESLLASGPLDVPIGEIAGPKASRYNSLEGDSGFCGDFSLQSVSSVGSPSYWTPVASPEARNSLGSLCSKKQSGGSLSSLQRRWIRNMSTSLELGLGQTDDVPSSCNGQHRRTKLGLAVVVTLTEERTREMEVFLFEHMSIIEAMIERLRFTVERAYLRKETFVHLMHEGWSDMQQSICDMLCSQRLQCPIWLTLTSTENKSHASLASLFLQDLCILISTLDTKATNFFVSTLVTGILTHHLGWVNTVWPAANAQTSSAVKNTEVADSLNDLLKSHPYNPLWAQLGDLYGALGSPTKIAKTIITTNGRKTDCVSKLLACMTYFIRCGEVAERASSRRDTDVDEALTELSQETQEGKKSASPELFPKPRTKSDKTTVDMGNKSSGTFFAILRDESDVLPVMHQDPSSCTLTGEDSVNRATLETQSESCQPVAPNVDALVASATDRIVPAVCLHGATCDLPKPDGISDKHNRMRMVSRTDLDRDPDGIARSSGLLSTESCSTDLSEMEKSGPKSSYRFEDPLCFSHSVGPSSSFYVEDTQKRLNIKLEILSQEMEQFKEGKKFTAQALRGGNFASPAGAEWENENYPTSPSHSGRTSAERDYPSDRMQHGFCMGDDSIVSKDCSGASGGSFLHTGDTDGGENGQTENEALYRRSSACGLGSMRRTPKCVSQMSDLKSTRDSCSNLYPSIGELAKMENIRLDTDSPYAGNLVDDRTVCDDHKARGFRSETVDDNFLNTKGENFHELISNKVSKLCRVPTAAVMFHLDAEVEETEFKAITPAEESFETKRSNSERQRRSFDGSRLRRSKNSSVPSFRDLDEASSSSPGVVFVLGDNEELKGIGKRCSSGRLNVDGCEDDDKSSILWACASIDDGVASSVITSEPKVVTVKSAYIDLEDGVSLSRTEVVNECGTENALSFSVSLPVVRGHRRAKKSTKIVRRHTEKYCDRCRTILRAKCDDGGVHARRGSFVVGCDKCYCSPRGDDNDANFGSLGNPDHHADWTAIGAKHISRSHDHMDLRGGTGEEACESSLEPDVDCPREDNAIFEQYDPSDEEILGPHNVEPKVVVPKSIGYGDLRIVDLPLPRCEPRIPEVVGLAASLLGGVSPRYVPDLVLQGCVSPPQGWEAALRRDLTLAAKLPLLGHEVAEAVCVLANTHTWEVQLVSSHAYVVDKPGTLGVCVGMSQLVANMLESLVHLWRLRMPPEHCLLHMESKLRELYLRSQALAELLLTTEFCNMELLTSSLDLEANDVPLLLAVASTHSPQIAHRYGLSFG